MTGFGVDPSSMAGISAFLSAGSDDLEAVGGSVPSMPDAGELSSSLAAAAASLLENGGEVSTGLAAAADAVTESGAVYAASDEGTAGRFNSTGGVIP